MAALAVYTTPTKLAHAHRVISTTMAGLVAEMRAATAPTSAVGMLAMEQ